MAIFSTHILNSVDGTHFAGIFIKLLKINDFKKMKSFLMKRQIMVVA